MESNYKVVDDVTNIVTETAINANSKVCDEELSKKNILLCYSDTYNCALKCKKQLNLDSPIFKEIYTRINTLTKILNARLQTAHFTINTLISMFRAKVCKKEYSENGTVYEKKTIQTGGCIMMGISNFICEKMSNEENQAYTVEVRKLSHLLYMECHLHTVLLKFLCSLNENIDFNEFILGNKTVHNILGTLNIISPLDAITDLERLAGTNKQCMESVDVDIDYLIEKIRLFRNSFETNLSNSRPDCALLISKSQRVNDFYSIINIIRYMVIDNLYVYFCKIQMELENKSKLIHKDQTIELKHQEHED